MLHFHCSLKRHGPGLLLMAALLGLLVAAIQPALAQTLTTLYSFTGGADGAYPHAGLIRDAQGNLYGTTESAGGSRFSGTVFEITPNGKEIVLHSFSSYGLSAPPSPHRAMDGSYPIAGLVMDLAGNLYGTTEYGGIYGCERDLGCGTVFELTPAGTETVLYAFTGGKDGAYPPGDLVRDDQGNLYGTTYQGGAYGWGTVFEVTGAGAETVLYSFGSQKDDGINPGAGLVRDAEGNLYGTTSRGGTYWGGTVFKVTPTGTETVLHSFGGSSDGCSPIGGLLRDAEGNLYGTTEYCGNAGAGTVFKVTPSGAETVLYGFTGGLSGGPDGAWPYAGLVMDAEGYLYGTTYSGGGKGCGVGGGYGCGTIFEITPAGTETVLYRFTGGADGGFPTTGLVMDLQGNFYGTTEYGGNSNCNYGNGCGVVFKLTP